MIQRPYKAKTYEIRVDGGRKPEAARMRTTPSPAGAPPSKAVPAQPATGRNRMPTDRIWGG